jgi:hypothetical protein
MQAQKMDGMVQQETKHGAAVPRKGVRRTVTLLAVAALVFYALSFLQILLMK